MCDLFKRMIYRPLSAQFEITEGCTHNCRHCYNYYSHDNKNSSTTSKVIEKIAKQDFFDITLTGGDPLYSKGKLYEAIEKFKQKNMDVRMNSNLHLLNEADANRIADLKLNSILSSILGPNENTHDFLTGVNGSFGKLQTSLKYLTDRNIGVAMNMVVNKANLSEVYKTGKFLFETFGTNYFCATPMVISPGKNLEDITLSRKEYIQTLDNLLQLEQDFGMIVTSLNPAVPCMFPEEEQERYKRFFEERGCSAGQGTLTFSTKGDVRVCSQESRIYGNILDDSLENILQEMSAWAKGVHIPKECSPCDYMSLCKGGCRVSAEADSGNLNGLEPYFTNPVKRNISLKEEEKIDFNQLKISPGFVKTREEENGLTTIYISSKANAVVTPTQLAIFQRFMSNRSFAEILQEVKNKEILEEICTKFSRRKLLV